MNMQINPYLYKVLVSVSVSYLLLILFRAIHFRLKGLELISKYSYQIFFLDSFVKVGLFSFSAKIFHINTFLVITFAVCNVILSVIICIVCSKSKWISKLLSIETSHTKNELKARRLG